ncbi:PHB depolymerase family esterase [Geothrix sp. PMB-07]|uniref:alpha/beta hydrolase family esterase n=1 Tax=Geothrix sp. PMB-07 TaxID=3068640 RepID=UPI002741D55F|nr:PHB depolymerase family esterase [Geothrix sp. PMB-07]WLT31769.1 PHB depolymerase family esterase [Geothrix sp. PMB-07]
MPHGQGHYLKLTWQGEARRVLVHDPPGHEGRSLPLVLALHGTGGTGRIMAHLSGLSRLADERGFRVAYPQALGEAGLADPARGAAWNAGPGLGCPPYPEANDVGFLQAVVDRVDQHGPVDPRRIYVAGFSNGARMAYRLALSAPWVAAMAAVAGAPVWGEAPVRPVPTLVFHGTEDQHIPFSGGLGQQGRRLPALPAREAAERWAALMGCGPASVSDELNAHRLEMWSSDACQVGFWTVADMGHAWPGGRPYAPGADLPVPDLSAAHLIWAFFEAHPLEAP